MVSDYISTRLFALTYDMDTLGADALSDRLFDIRSLAHEVAPGTESMVAIGEAEGWVLGAIEDRKEAQAIIDSEDMDAGYEAYLDRVASDEAQREAQYYGY